MTTPRSGLLIFVSGPSGAGKSTVCRRLATELPAEFGISSTTRPGKPQDAQGKKYFFVDEATFRRQLEAGEFLEYAEVFGNWYGTLKKPVQEALAAGKTVLLEIDIQGAQNVHRIFPDALGIFILPPDEETLLERLRNRGRDDEATIQKRFNQARQEMVTARELGIYDLFVVNKDLDEAMAKINLAIAQFRQRKMTGNTVE